jgi:hypothetical protein
MTEAEWLACADPQPMLEFLRDKATERKLRLFAVACCRRNEELMANASSQMALEASEDYADGQISRKELKGIRRAVWEALFSRDSKAAWEAAGSRTWETLIATLWRLGPFSDKTCQVALLYDCFGPFPFRPVAVAASWLAWNDGAVRKMAQAIYDERAFDRLPLLADALEDAGCTSADILAHCRGPGPHVRGCWVVDLVLGKE